MKTLFPIVEEKFHWTVHSGAIPTGTHKLYSAPNNAKGYADRRDAAPAPAPASGTPKHRGQTALDMFKVKERDVIKAEADIKLANVARTPKDALRKGQ
ncbi:hypothetical protein FB451DRAFT_1410386 [Mycena latifolia]|nr:hypothetical protein FB451DRAFT_1416109 [Mycena latifolia]KAJ7450409.1 hypothetical protein FB451DRAFT_1410386 [Mycena latifolia]